MSELPLLRGYRRVVGSISTRFMATDLAAPPETPPRCSAPPCWKRCAAYFTANGFDANWAAIEGMADDELVVTLCMVCPFGPCRETGPAGSQRPARRADTLITLLQMGAHTPLQANRFVGRRRRAAAHSELTRLMRRTMTDAPEPDANPAPPTRALGLDPKLLEILVCPVTKQPLVYDQEAAVN